MTSPRFERRALRTAVVAALAAPLIVGCAATVQRSDGSAAAPSASSGKSPAAAQASSMKIPAASAKRMVLNMQLAPQHPKSDGWTAFRQEWYDIGKEQAAAKQMAFATQDGDAKPTGEEGTLVVVKVADYKHVSQAARIMLGIMTGNSFINAKVEFRDLKTGALHGERSYDTSSSAWQGVFAPTTYKQIYALIDEFIVEIGRS